MAGHFNYATNTWYDLKDVQGPKRDVVRIDDSQGTATLITFTCGHVGEFNPIFSYKDKRYSCFECLYAPDNVIRKVQQ